MSLITNLLMQNIKDSFENADTLILEEFIDYQYVVSANQDELDFLEDLYSEAEKKQAVTKLAKIREENIALFTHAEQLCGKLALTGLWSGYYLALLEICESLLSFATISSDG